MTLDAIREELKKDSYSFLSEHPYLGGNVGMLCLGGSHAYGTNTETSDLDIRGFAYNSKRSILTGKDFEQVTNTATDTTIYSFDKLVKLLCSCNPNTIEMLGLKPEHYLFLDSGARVLLDNRRLFLSRVAIYSFGGYANDQLRRLENKACRSQSQAEQEANILKSIKFAYESLKTRYFDTNEDSIDLYLDTAVQEDFDQEIFMDIKLTHYPLRDYTSIWNDMKTIVHEYAKIGKRNSHAIEHGKLGKHMMHLIRLYMMCLDILERKEIVTYREKEHDFLMSIRNGKYLDENGKPVPEFYDIVSDFEKRMNYAKENTDLPDKVDMEKVYDLIESVNSDRVAHHE